MAADKPISVGDWLDQFVDLDTYIANGGQLLDLPINALDMVHPSMVESLVRRMSEERMNHLARFRDRRPNPAQQRDRAGGETTAEPEAAPVSESAPKDVH
ncbi:MAG TPA: hypothetical protein VLX44_13650 [Xanthobacteraceae bacterium]|nr:hypothetical protein [Xanthobacteraceae bacterium]